MTSCPAFIASVTLEAPHGFEGRVELFGCPAAEAAIKRGPGTNRLNLFDVVGQKVHSHDTKEEGSAELQVKSLYGDARPVFFLTTTPANCAGSSCGPTTQLVEIASGKLRRLRATMPGGKEEDIVLASTLRRTWWIGKARSGRGSDLFEVLSPATGDAKGTRYAFEGGRWTGHQGVLEGWTGEHLASTDASFP